MNTKNEYIYRLVSTGLINMRIGLILFFIYFFCFHSSNTYGNNPTANFSSGLVFKENKGQVKYDNGKIHDAKFFLQGKGVQLFFTTNGIQYNWRSEVIPFSESGKKESTLRQVSTFRIDMNFVGGNENVTIVGEEMNDDYDNYYTDGKEYLNVRNYKRIVYKNLYKGIDAVFYIRDGKLKYDFIVNAGADYRQIKFSYSGEDKLVQNDDGSITIKSPLGAITDSKPISFTGNKKVKTDFSFNRNEISFNVKGDVSGKKIIIDPSLIWSTYYGGEANDQYATVKYDGSGSLYIAGYSASTVGISTPGAFQTGVLNTNGDAYIAKFTTNGVRVWGTYCGGFGGGTGIDEFRDIDLNSAGDILAAGTTTSPNGISTPGAFQTVHNPSGTKDGFIVKFTPVGTRVWATYYGGNHEDEILAIDHDGADNFYVTGYTDGSVDPYLGTAGTYHPTPAGNYEAFIGKFNSSGMRVWGTFFGGSSGELAWDIVADASGNTYITGWTQSTTGVATAGAFQTIQGGSADAFLAKLTSTGNLSWSTYLGGGSFDEGLSVTLDESGNVYAGGSTAGPAASFVTAGTHQITFGGVTDGYLLKFTPAGARIWGTLYGGTSDESITSIIATNGNVWIAGQTGSSCKIATPDAFQTSLAGSFDSYVAKLTNSGTRIWGTYYGSTNMEVQDQRIAYDNGGNLFLAGTTGGNTGISTAGAHQTTFGGGNFDCYLAKINDNTSPATVPSIKISSVNPGNTVCGGKMVTFTATPTNQSASAAYQWKVNNTNVGTNALTYSSNTLANGDKVYVVMSWTDPCFGPLTYYSDTVTMVINGNLPLELGNDTIVCGAGPLTIGNTIAGATYTWSNGANTPTISVNASGKYYVDVSTASCSGSDTINVTFVAPPTVNVPDDTVCVSTYTMDAGNPGATYLWSTGETTQQITITKSGKYWVRVTKNSCSAADTARIHFWGQVQEPPVGKWYFGFHAGLDFSSGSGTVVNDGINDATDGSATMTDSDGNLLFYSNGINVWNKNHQAMQNGTGLDANPGFTQNSVIIEDPANPGKYLLFTNGNNGVKYSVIDTSMNNGAGSVISSNNAVVANTTEKLAAIKDNNGNVWIVTHLKNSNTFVSIKVSSSGVSNTAVTSNVGSIVTGTGKGYLKFSQDGKRAVVANNDNNTVEVFDFDQSTGKFSNPKVLSVRSPYGVEFSEDGTLLYVTGSDQQFDATHGEHLYQYDLLAGTTSAADIQASQIEIANTVNTGSVQIRALQLGPDGKIYVAMNKGGAGFLSTIESPGLRGSASNFKYESINLGAGATSGNGLPNVIVNPVVNGSFQIVYADTCFGSVTLFEGFAPDTIYTWNWNFGDPASGSNTANTQLTSHQFSAVGNYTVTLTMTHFCGTKILTQNVRILASPVKPLGTDTTLCTPQHFLLDAKNAGASYLWNTGATSKTITTDTSGTFVVIISNGSCTISDTIQVSFINAGALTFGNDTSFCNGDAVLLKAPNFPGATYTWNDNSHKDSLIVTTTSKYYLTIDLSICKLSDTINIGFITPPVVNLGIDTTLCQGASIVKNITNAGFSYRWNDNTTSPTKTISAAGLYWAEAYKSGCRRRDTINVNVVSKPVVDLGPDQTYCNGDPVILDAGNPGLTYVWSNGANTQQITANTTGKYKVTVTRQYCPSVLDSVSLTFITPAVINLGNDTTICSGSVITLDAANPGYSYLWNNGTTSQTIQVGSTGKYKVNVYKGSCTRSDSINISVINGPVVTLPPQTIICSEQGETVLLSPGAAFKYLWSTSDTSSTLLVSAEGVYSVNAYNSIGCSTVVSASVRDICEPQLFVPSAFSPNGDGKNDDFELFGANILKIDFRLFNQWGEVVYHTDKLNDKWDGTYKGKTVPDGAYIWKAEFTGETVDGTETVIKTGDVTVVK